MVDIVEAARRHDDAFNAHDPDARIAAMTPDTELVVPGGITLSGSEQVMGFLQVFWEAMPDAHIAAANHVAAGDTIALEATLTGTHTGTFRAPQGDVPATGKRIELRAAAFKKFRDGRVASEHLYFDQLDFLQQLGVIPR